jgi:hypothetical protein
MGESSYDIGRGAPPITWAQALGCREPLQLRHKGSLGVDNTINTSNNNRKY